jgi:hypothetical protein
LIDFLARHAEIRGSIIKLRSKTAASRNHLNGDQALIVEAEHAKWWTTVDEHFSGDEHTQSITKPHQVTLIVLRYESILALHRATLANPKPDAAYNAALQRCVTASRSIINTLHGALKGFGAFDGSPGQYGYESIPLLWPSFTWAVWMSTFVVIFAATEKQLSHRVALRLADRSVKVLQHIALRGTNWPDSCVVAIKNLIAGLETSLTQESGMGDFNASEARSLSESELLVPAQSSQLAQERPHQPLRSRNASQNQSYLHTSLQYTAPNVAATTRFPGNFHPSFAPTMIVPNNTHSVSTPAQFVNTQVSTALASNQLHSSGSFLGIAQQLSDIPRPNDDITHLFNGEDMTWWMGDDFGLDGVL